MEHGEIKPYEDLKKEHMPRLHIPYLLLLLTTEWREKRLTIIQRDNKLCTNCGKAETVTPNISGLATHSFLCFNQSFIFFSYF